jgi:hypothetical protein
MGKIHQNKKKTAQPKSETIALGTRKKINTINRKETKQYSNPCGPIECSYGGHPPFPTSKSSSAFNPRLSDPF